MPIIQGDVATLTDGATVATDASLGDYFTLSGYRAARTMSNPTNGVAGEVISYLIENTGGVVETSWGTGFVLAGPWTDPAADRARSVTFFYDGTNWIETTRSGADLRRIAFEPPDVASLVAWYEAEDLGALADGDPVTTWTARVGPDIAAPSGKEPTFKTAIQNSRPIVRFDGTDDYLTTVLNPLLGATDASVFAVFAKADTLTGIRALADIAGTGLAGLVFFAGHTTANIVYAQFGVGGSTTDHNEATSVGTAFHQWSWTVPNASLPKLYKDAGSAINPVGSHNAGFTVAQASLYVGSNAGTQRYLYGDLAELLLFSTALSDADRALVATYLKTKWGTP